MKYVCHDAFISSSAPKAAKEVIELMKSAPGTEMQREHLEAFINKLRGMVDEVNKKGKVELKVETYKVHDRWGLLIERRSLYVQRKRNYGPDDVARIYFVSVNSQWVDSPVGRLYMMAEGGEQ